MASQNKQNQLSKDEIFNETLIQTSSSAQQQIFITQQKNEGGKRIQVKFQNVLLPVHQSRQGDWASQHHCHLPIRHCLSLLPGEWEERYLALQEPTQTPCMSPLFPALAVKERFHFLCTWSLKPWHQTNI